MTTEMIAVRCRCSSKQILHKSLQTCRDGNTIIMRNFSHPWTDASFAFAIWLSLWSTQAQSFDLKVFGSSVSVKQLSGERTLEVAGRTLLRDGIIVINEIERIGGTTVLIGVAGSGGNACDVSHFVLSLAPRREPRLDGPVEACGSRLVSVGDDGVVFEKPAIAGRDGQRWRWTDENGLQSLGKTAHIPARSDGWAALRERRMDHPFSLFDLADISDDIAKLVGGGIDDVRVALSGPGSGRFEGDLFIGQACRQASCGEVEALVVAEIPKRRIFVAHKPANRSIAAYPRVEDWPPQARSALRNWARKWRAP